MNRGDRRGPIFVRGGFKQVEQGWCLAPLWAAGGTWRGCGNSAERAASLHPPTNACWEYGNLINWAEATRCPARSLWKQSAMAWRRKGRPKVSRAARRRPAQSVL